MRRPAAARGLAGGAAAGLVAAVVALAWPEAPAAVVQAPPAGPGAPATATPPLAPWGHSAGLRAPRCIRLDPARDRAFVTGTDGRVHVFAGEGTPVASWTLPGPRDGNPQGIAVDRDGNLLVADTHASRVLRCAPDGRLLATYGRPGTGPGEFHWPTGVCEAADGTLWVTEYGTQDRLHHLAADGSPLAVIGATGHGVGEWYRPSNVRIGPDGNVWVADACNHRLQAVALDGTLVAVVDASGTGEPLRNPYDFAFARDGACYVAEFGASRIRRLAPGPDGRVAGGAVTTVAGTGAQRGAVCTPWGVDVAAGCLCVADTGNHRVQAGREADGLAVARLPRAGGGGG